MKFKPTWLWQSLIIVRRYEDQSRCGANRDNEDAVSRRMGGRAAGAAGGCKARGGPATILFPAIGLGSDRSHKVVAHNEREC